MTTTKMTHKFLAGLKFYRPNATADKSRDFYLPAMPDNTKNGWYGYRIGSYRYAGAKKWTREERCMMILKVTDKPFLWGMDFPRNYDTSDIAPTHAENSQLFFGCSSWGDLLTPAFIVTHSENKTRIKDAAKKLRAGGIDKAAYKKLIDLDLLAIPADLIIEVRDMLDMPDIADIVRWLEVFDLSVRAANEIWKSSSVGKLITVNYEGQQMDYRSKKPKESLHDFLAALAAAAERRSGNQALISFPACPFEPPEGFDHLASGGSLVSVSRKNGWCAGQKHYRQSAELGNSFFFFDADKKILAQYDAQGNLMQVRGKNNLIGPSAPKQLSKI